MRQQTETPVTRDTSKGEMKGPLEILKKKASQIASATSVVLLLATSAAAQAPPECQLPASGNVANPSRVCFEASPDHDSIDSYALDLYSADGTLVNTLDMGKPGATTTADGSRWVVWNNLNVMPTTFGNGYFARARSIANGATGPDSEDSNAWDRVPGPPSGNPRLVGTPQWLSDHYWARWGWRPARVTGN